MRKLYAVLFLALLLTTLAIAAFPVKALTLEDGLVLHYDMDKGYGSTLDDSSSYANTGTITGASWVIGKYGHALSFDGTNDNVTVPNSANLQTTTFTVSLWIKATNNVGHLIQKEPNPDGWYIRHDSDGKVTLEIWNTTADGIQSLQTLTLNTYYHITCVVEAASSLKIYINGVLDNSKNTAKTVGINSGALTLMTGDWASPAGYATGIIDEVRVYNRALSQAEISELYAYSPYQVPSSFNTNTAIYALSTTQTVNNLTGYELSETAPGTTTGTNITVATSGSESASWAWRVYLKYQSGAVELSSGTPTAIVTRASDGTGLQTATLSITTTNLQFGYTALELVLYSRFGLGEWTAQAVFLTDLLFYTQVLANTWTFQLWTERAESGGYTYATARWGNSSYVTGVSGLVYKQPDQFDWQTYHLRNGDPFGFITAPYIFLVGNLFYAVIGFGFCGTLYVRYRNAGVVLVLLILFGGTGGIANLMLGDAVLGIVWLLATFGFAALFWRVFR